MERYSYGASKDLVSDKEEIECSNLIKQYKNFDDVVKNIKEHNPD